VFFSAHRRARAWLCLSILRSLRGNAEKKRGEWRAGKKASVVVVFFNWRREQKNGFTLPSRLSGAYRSPACRSLYLERGQGLVAAPHWVNKRGEHPPSLCVKRARAMRDEEDGVVVARRKKNSPRRGVEVENRTRPSPRSARGCTTRNNFPLFFFRRPSPQSRQNEDGRCLPPGAFAGSHLQEMQDRHLPGSMALSTWRFLS